VTFGEITRLVINVPPGFMKSMLVDVFWPAWDSWHMGIEIHRQDHRQGEGIVSKRRDSRYISGRSPHWIKSKNPACAAMLR